MVDETTVRVITQPQAKSAGLMYYYTGKLCKGGHIDKRFVSSRNCVVCVRKRSINWQKNNKDARKVIQSKWNRDNKEYYQLYWSDKMEKRRVIANKWIKNNRSYCNSRLAKYRSAKLNATPKWIDEKAIDEIYKECKLLTHITGIKYNVDHIIPLVSDLVCGLHVESNLQIITARENQKKSNKLEVSNG